jgi:threonine synthase
MMQYQSTRGRAQALYFEAVVLAGLAADGGLYLPEALPHFTMPQLAAMAQLDYPSLALEVMWPFMEGALPREDAEAIINESYAAFRHSAIAPLKQLNSDAWLLELFHGPTLAFKDFALQFLGRLVDYFLTRRDERVVVLGATSGDTGSAALAGMRGRDRIQSFILFPHGRVSEVQRRQMTTMPDSKIHNLALQGTFDDCQDIVKALFADADFRKDFPLVAVNSINWARIMAQIVYYFYAAFRLGAPANSISFSVPTGNFGDIYAGFLAAQMGLPVEKLIIASNANDILTRCLHTGIYGAQGVQHTLSPSMDIQISSNFERLLYNLHGADAAAMDALMAQFKQARSITLPPLVLQSLQQHFAAYAVDDAQTLATMQQAYASCGELLDPHTAVGLCAAQQWRAASGSLAPLVTLATAHPAKFPDAVNKACGVHPALPAHLADLFEREERYATIANDISAVKHAIAKGCGAL